MDNSSALLNDLLLTLECGICLEQLEVTSKVLPCQHTFCRRCLESIVQSQKELRCPECRVVVDVKVSELPSNILLIRLLDGIKKTANIKDRDHVQTRCPTPKSNFRIGHQVFQESSPKTIGSSNSPPRPKSSSSAGHDQLNTSIINQCQSTSNVVQNNALSSSFASSKMVRAKAMFTYNGHEGSSNYLTFKEGEILTLLKRVDGGRWFEAELNGRRGIVPSTYLRIIPLNAEARALYDFEITDPVHQDDCLVFKKGDIIHVLKKVDDNWAEGQMASRTGIFPLSFVELNSIAKNLMIESSSKSSQLVITGNQGVTSNVNNITSNVTNSKLQTLPASDSSSVSNSNCSSSSNLVNLHSRPHFVQLPIVGQQLNPMMHVKSLGHLPLDTTPLVTPKVVATNQQIYDQIMSKRHSFCELGQNSTSESSNSLHQRSKSNIVGDQSHQTNVMQVVTSSSRTCDKMIPRNLVSQSQSSTSCCYIATFSYRPQKMDELELRKGDLYIVNEKCQDGWFRGKCIKTGLEGVFPGNYVQISNSRTSALPQVATNGVQPPPLMPKPKLIHVAPNVAANVQMIYAKPRSTNSSPQTTQPWVRPPVRPPQTLPLVNTTTSSRTTSPVKSDTTPSPQWPTVKVAAIQKSRVSSISQPSSPTNEMKSDESTKSNVTSCNEGRKLTFMKRWTNRRKTKSPNALRSNFYCDNPSFESTSPPPSVSSVAANFSSVHARSGSCPSEVLKGQGSSQRSQDRFKCVIPFPPNSDHELELKLGDIVQVSKKRDDGWFKGTLLRTGKVGLFPGSFVESC